MLYSLLWLCLVQCWVGYLEQYYFLRRHWSIEDKTCLFDLVYIVCLTHIVDLLANISFVITANL